MTIRPTSAIQILSVSENSNGRVALIAADTVPGGEPPCHRHHWEDEVLYVLQGEVVAWMKGVWKRIPPGDALFIPRGSNHTFTVISPQARVLMLVVPAGFENFYKELQATTLWLPSHSPAIEQWVVAAAHYGCEITAPHPGQPVLRAASDETIE